MLGAYKSVAFPYHKLGCEFRVHLVKGSVLGATWVFSAVKWGMSRYLPGLLEDWDASQHYLLLTRSASIHSIC